MIGGRLHFSQQRPDGGVVAVGLFGREIDRGAVVVVVHEPRDLPVGVERDDPLSGLEKIVHIPVGRPTPRHPSAFKKRGKAGFTYQ